MSMAMKLILSCVGVFIGGATGYYQIHTSDPLNARFWVGIVFAGLGPLAAYFVGLTQKSPWNGATPPAQGAGAVKPLLLLPFLFAALALTGCTTPISQSLTADISAAVAPAPHSLGSVVLEGLKDATYNLDQAVAVGALDKTDPAPGCFHGILTQLGVEVPAGAAPPASFTPKVSDLISAGSVLYIRAKQSQKLRGAGITAPASCKELVTQFLLDGAAAATDALPGGGLLPKLR